MNIKQIIFIPSRLYLLLFTGLLITLPNILCAQDKATMLYNYNCAACHSIGKGVIVGPDLMGIEQRLSRDWLIKFIKSSQTMIDSGDKEAVAAYEKFNKIKMPDFDLSTAEIQLILDHIKSFSKSPVSTEASAQKAQSASTKDSTENLKQVIKEIEIQQNTNKEQLTAIGKKLDMILEFQKKALSAPATKEEISKGEALFDGDIPFKEDIPRCVSCHNNKVIDTLNWNPSALDIAVAFSHKDRAEMINAIINPQSKKMQDVLNTHRLTDDEAFFIAAYLKDLERQGLKPEKKFPVHRAAFIGACLIMFLFLFDLLITQKIKRKYIPVTVITLMLAYITYTLYHEARLIGLSPNYAPVQPIKFSHRIHVKENRISCLFCHNGPEYSPDAGIPTLNICMACHNQIKTGQRTGGFEISKIRKSFEEKKPITWVKIYSLPDFVFFSHAEHVSVGKIDCRKCHGPVEDMDVTYQYSSLSMGWCVQCHRQTEVQFTENKFYSGYEGLINELKSGKIKRVTADMIGANDCQKCHY